jgi:sulfide dehydrogenase cytochrome subunit
MGSCSIQVRQVQYLIGSANQQKRCIMKQRIQSMASAGVSALLLATLAACGGGSDPSADVLRDSAQAASSSAGIAQPVNTAGRLLASNCFQCHGTLGLGGFDKIRGSSADEALEFMSKPAKGNIMAAHAQGYTTAQL